MAFVDQRVSAVAIADRRVGTYIFYPPPLHSVLEVRMGHQIRSELIEKTTHLNHNLGTEKAQY